MEKNGNFQKALAMYLLFTLLFPWELESTLKTINTKILAAPLPSVQDHDVAVTTARAHLGTWTQNDQHPGNQNVKLLLPHLPQLTPPGSQIQSPF